MSPANLSHAHMREDELLYSDGVEPILRAGSHVACIPHNHVHAVAPNNNAFVLRVLAASPSRPHGNSWCRYAKHAASSSKYAKPAGVMRRPDRVTIT